MRKILILILLATNVMAQDPYPQVNFFDSSDFAVLQSPLFTAKFSKKLGGGWNEFLNRTGQPVLSNHPGESALVMYVTGNDPTQGAPYPISAFKQMRSPAIPAYVEESAIGSFGYATQGSVAPFWISHEARDDSFEDIRDWSTLYNDFLQFGAIRYIQFDTPIFFKANSPAKSSGFFLGDELGGNKAAYHLTNSIVSAADVKASADLPRHPGVVASVLAKTMSGNVIRMDINTNGDYCTLLNYSVLFCGRYNVNKLYSQGMNIKIELLDGVLRAFIDKQLVGTKSLFIVKQDWVPGVAGRSINNKGYFSFGYREVLDPEEKFVTHNSLDSTGGLKVKTNLYTRNKVRGTNFPTFFLDPGVPREAFKVALKDGTILNTEAEYLQKFPNALVNINEFHASYVGSADGKRGIMLYKVETPDSRGHILVSKIATAVNSSPQGDYNVPQYLPGERAELSAVWLPEFNEALFNCKDK